MENTITLKKINGDYIEIYSDCITYFDMELKENRTISIAEFFCDWIPEKNRFELFNWRRECFDLIGETISNIERFCSASFSMGFNPLPQLRNKFREYDWIFAHENNYIQRLDNIFIVMKDNNNLVRILIPKNAKQIIIEKSKSFINSKDINEMIENL